MYIITLIKVWGLTIKKMIISWYFNNNNAFTILITYNELF